MPRQLLLATRNIPAMSGSASAPAVLATASFFQMTAFQRAAGVPLDSAVDTLLRDSDVDDEVIMALRVPESTNMSTFVALDSTGSGLRQACWHPNPGFWSSWSVDAILAPIVQESRNQSKFFSFLSVTFNVEYSSSAVHILSFFFAHACSKAMYQESSQNDQSRVRLPQGGHVRSTSRPRDDLTNIRNRFSRCSSRLLYLVRH